MMKTQYPPGASTPADELDLMTDARNIWLLSSEEIPPILFSPERVAELLGVGRDKVYRLMQQQELRSVKVGYSRRVSARAICDFVERLEMGEPA